MTRPPTPDERHVLRPGVVVLAHPPDHLVVTDDRCRVRLRPAPAVRDLLDRLATAGAPPPHTTDPPEAWRAWGRLSEAGLLVAAGTLTGARRAVRTQRPGPAPGHQPALADAAALAYGDEAVGALRGRLAATVVVHAPETLRPAATAALGAAGVRVAGPRARGALHLVLSDVTPDPRVVAPLMRSGTPHFSVVRDTSGVTVGPFVVPGHTACTGCLEATHADRDPHHGVLRLLRARQLRGEVLPEDPAVTALALAAAARDVTVWAAGDAPLTWSATRHFAYAAGSARPTGDPPAGGTGDERLPLPRHPRCGCAWDVLGAEAG